MQCGKVTRGVRNVSMAMLKHPRRLDSAATAKPIATILSVARPCARCRPAPAPQPIETEHLFGFTIGSDVGEVGERELEGSVTGRFSKRTGTYDAGSGTMSVEFVPLPNLRTEFTGVVNSYDIAGVSGFADQRYTAFGGLSADIRYRLLDRASAPFGFAIGAEPHWGRADDVTGEPVSQYGVDFVAAADWEIIPDRVVAAFNLLYQPDTMRAKLTGIWSQEVHRRRRVCRDGAGSSGGFRRRRSPLFAPI